MANKKFVALESGTFSNPFRYIPKDSILDSSEIPQGFEAPWLVSQEDYNLIRRSDVPMSHMSRKKPPRHRTSAQPLMATEFQDPYSRQMDSITAREAAEPISAPVPSGESESKEETSGEAAQSTGDQDVFD